jgi:hypothetical protein
VGRAADRAVGGETDRITDALGFEKLIRYPGLAKPRLDYAQHKKASRRDICQLDEVVVTVGANSIGCDRSGRIYPRRNRPDATRHQGSKALADASSQKAGRPPRCMITDKFVSYAAALRAAEGSSPPSENFCLRLG